MTPETCPHRVATLPHEGQCQLVSILAGVPIDQAVIPTRACADCCLDPPTLARPNRVVAQLTRRIVNEFNPDGASAIDAEMRCVITPYVPPVPATRDVVLNADAHGYGDAMVTAWISEGSKEAPVRLLHHATGRMRDFLEMWGQVVVPLDDGAATTFDAYEWETRRERGTVPRVITRGRHLGIFSEPKRPRIQFLPQTALELADDMHTERTDRGRKPYIVLCPQTNYASREWPASHWIDLAWRLEKAGCGVTVMLGEAEERFDKVPQFFFGWPWPHIVALMLRADLVVGIDSGPIHVAGTLDVPTLALLGPTTGSVISHCPSVTCLSPPRDRIDCVGCWFNAPYRVGCDQGCQALSRLYVDDVFEAIEERFRA